MALKRSPDYPTTHRNLAMAYVQISEVQMAIASMEKYIGYRPDDEKAKEVLDLLYVAAAADTTSPSGPR